MQTTTFLRLRALVALLALSFGCSLHADDVVDNLGNATVAAISLSDMAANEGAAEAFTTGPESTTLDSITVRLEHVMGANSTARVELWSSESDLPTNLIELVGRVTNFTTLGNFTVNSSNRPVLSPNTTYWVVVVWESGDFDWSSTVDLSITAASTGTLPMNTALSSDGTTWAPRVEYINQQFKVNASPETDPAVIASRASLSRKIKKLKKKLKKAKRNGQVAKAKKYKKQIKKLTKKLRAL